jgi:hypothetical protein
VVYLFCELSRRRRSGLSKPASEQESQAEAGGMQTH